METLTSTKQPRTVLFLIHAALSITTTAAFSPITRRQSRTFSTLLGVVSENRKNKAGVSEETRLKRTSSLGDWAESVGIQVGGIKVASTPSSGLGLITDRAITKGEILLQVPTDVALSVETPRDSNPRSLNLFRDDAKSVYRDAPWWAQLSLQLNVLDSDDVSSPDDVNYGAWMDSLPRKFNTPLHWDKTGLDALQYPHMTDAVRNQETVWKSEYERLVDGMSARSLTYQQFTWGCECARSRAFSGSYSGSAFKPAPYAFTLALVAGYLGFNIGTLEQAANGAALVVCGSIIKDFVLPKLVFKKKLYLICPVIDMANHVGVGGDGDVAFEYFSDGYSLTSANDRASGKEVTISYGVRSNDQLLQYYGFVETNNPHDVYVMPPLRNWDIGALEIACGRDFMQGRLAKLDNAGLLGRKPEDITALSTSGENANDSGGVVITRSGGLDPAVIQALRALVSSDTEWKDAGEAVGNFSEEFSEENERVTRIVAVKAIEMELSSRGTTLEEDQKLLKTMKQSKSLLASEEEMLAILFRIEKKKLLKETIGALQLL